MMHFSECYELYFVLDQEELCQSAYNFIKCSYSVNPNVSWTKLHFNYNKKQN